MNATFDYKPITRHCRHGFAKGKCLAPACEHYPQKVQAKPNESVSEFKSSMKKKGANRYDISAIDRLAHYVARGADPYRVQTWEIAAKLKQVTSKTDKRSIYSSLNRVLTLITE